MKTQQQLINNIIGQLNGVSRMIDNNKDCLAIVTQIKATHSALGSLMNKFVEENFLQCTRSYGEKNDNDLMKKLLAELTKK
jgi:DNA-binding FrmR family transcriptional regulator